MDAAPENKLSMFDAVYDFGQEAARLATIAPAFTTLAAKRDAWAAGIQVPRTHVVATVNIGASFTAIDALCKNVPDQLMLPFEGSSGFGVE